MINFNWYRFDELTTAQLYEVLKLRAEVFVVEQRCPYLDPDGRDITALHLLGTERGKVVACLRLFPPTTLENQVVFGRLVTCQAVRGKGYGLQLMQSMLHYCAEHYPQMTIQCSAQHYLLRFYSRLGFKAYGDVYMEDGIPHIAMQKN